MGLLDDEDEPGWLFDQLPTDEEVLLGILHDTVGDALDDVDAEPLPDEPLDLSAVPRDVHNRVTEVADLVDACYAELFYVEHRTACRRLLADAASADPAIFRRRARADTAAAAVVWLVAKANGTLGQHRGGLTAKAVGEWFGVGSNPGQRAPTLLRAIDAPDQRYAGVHLGSSRYLVSGHRSWVVETRERYGAGGAGR
jgi:hypothetical protein